MNLDRTFLALCMAVALGGCSDTPDTLLKSAQQYLAQHDQKAAIIQIKNLLQISPNRADARFLLGRVLLESGDPASAEVELRRALTLHYSTDAIVPTLSKALLAQGKFKKVVDEFGDAQLSLLPAQADLQLSLAQAYGMQNRPELADAALQAALRTAPAEASVQLSHAQRLARQHDYANAQTVLDALIAIQPGNTAAWKLKGDAYTLDAHLPEAEAAYRTALSIDPDYLPAQVGVVQSLQSRRALDEAERPLALLQKTAPDSPHTQYLSANMAYLKGDFKKARELVQRPLASVPNDVLVLRLAGMVEMQLEHPPQAQFYLERALELAPHEHLPRKLLVMLYLQQKQVDKALGVLEPGLNQTPVDPDFYALAGDVYVKHGELAKADHYFKLAQQQHPEDGRLKTTNALLDMARNPALGLEPLQSLAASDSDPSADVALISSLMQQRNYAQALSAVNALDKKKPDLPVAAYLRGEILTALHDMAGARTSLARAVSLQPNYFPAIRRLAAMDVAEHKPQDARKRFEALLKAEPDNLLALLGMAEFASNSGAPPAEVAGLLVRAVNSNPGSVQARAALIDFYLNNKEVNKALAAAQNAHAAFPADTGLLDALGRSQQAAGDATQAISTYEDLAQRDPKAVLPYWRMAEIQMANMGKSAAIKSLQRALSIQPDFLPAQRALAATYIADKRWSDALDIARTLQKQRPKSDVGYLLEADIQMGTEGWTKAVAALQTGIERSGATTLVIKQLSVLREADQAARALQVSAAWQKEHPDDALFLFYLGDQALLRRDFSEAEQHYQAVLRLQPNNANALNNLAWVSGQQNKKEAITYGEKAVALAPNQPDFLDTLATLHADKGNYTQALALQRRALALQPQNPGFKLNLARMQLHAGHKDVAKKLVDEMSALGEDFPEPDKFTLLRKELGSP